MSEFTSKSTGWLALLLGIMGILAVISLVLFFVGLFQHIPSLLFMGSLNDGINSLTSIVAAVLASVMYPALHKQASYRSIIVLIGTWVGAIAVTFGSWLILTGRSDVELSSYYFFLGNGLIGIWLWMVNRIASKQSIWFRNLARLGLIASGFMMIGLLGLYGILLGLDGDDYSPIQLMTGISYLGIGFLYPVWCLRLAHWILSKKNNDTAALQS